jgi:hypothetical protein
MGDRLATCHLKTIFCLSLTACPILCIVMEYADAGDLHDCIRRHWETRRPFEEVRSVHGPRFRSQ